MKLNYFVREYMRFRMPDAGGGGGGASVVDPPAGGADEIMDPLTYNPPAPADIETFLNAPEGTEPPKGTTDPAKPPPAKKEEPPVAKGTEKDGAQKAAAEKAAAEKVATEKAAADKKVAEAKAAADKKAGEGPGAKNLREQLTKLETTNADLQKQLEAAKSDTRIADLTKRIEGNESAIKEKEAAIADRDRKLLIHNPHVAKPLNDLKEAFNKEHAGFIDAVPTLEGEYRAMLDEFEALPRGTAEYAEKLAAFRANIKEAFGDDHQTVYDALRRGLRFRQEYGAEFKKVQATAIEEDFKGRRGEWESAHKEIDTEFSKWLEPPADYETTDPLNPVAFMKKFEELMPADQVGRTNANMKRIIDLAFNGAQPKTKADFVGMDDAQIEQELAAQGKQVQEARALAKRTLAVGGKVLAYLRPILAEYAKMRDKIAELTKSAPPDPSKTPGSESAGGGEDDLLNYEPPAVSESAVHA